MDQRVKELWVTALRSGEFKQCRSRLKLNTDGTQHHCCLGVLEELAKQEGVITGFDPAGLVLDTTVQNWAGLTAADPRINNGHTLTALNDGGSGFAYIADQIEKYL